MQPGIRQETVDHPGDTLSTRKHEVPDELLDEWLANCQKPEELIGENGLLKQLTKRLVERALDAEMTAPLGQERHAPVANASGHPRNGRSRKPLKGEFGELPIEAPRERAGSCEPQIVPKSTRRAGPAWTSRCCRCTPAG